jgi:hypothetical protein
LKPLLITETNFVCQLVLDRDGEEVSVAAQEILAYAEAGHIELRIPVFSLLESDFVFRSGRKRRNIRWKELEDEERELRRSPITITSASDLSRFRSSYVEIANTEYRRYEAVLDRLLTVKAITPLSQFTIQTALGIVQSCGLGLADAVVLASSLAASQEVESATCRLFLTTNKHDFNTPSVKRELEREGLELLTDYRGCRARLQAACEPT